MASRRHGDRQKPADELLGQAVRYSLVERRRNVGVPMSALIVAMSLVILHRIDGGEVLVAPEHITSMHSKAPTSAQNKLVTQEARCIVWLADGKQLVVLEPCETVKRLMEAAR